MDSVIETEDICVYDYPVVHHRNGGDRTGLNTFAATNTISGYSCHNLHLFYKNNLMI